MNNTILLFILLISHSINLSAAENSVPAEDAKTQPLPVSTNEHTDKKSAVKKQPTGRELMQQSLEMARLAAEIDRKHALYARGPKRKFISAGTQDPTYRAYMYVFARKLEEVGNANEEFKRKNIHGTVTVTISIGRDGALEEVRFNSFNTEKPTIVSTL